MVKPLPPHEQLSVSTDLPVLEAWIDEHPEVGADVAVDRAAFDSNRGHVLLVVHLRAHAAVRRVRDELVASVRYPERLRVRKWMPDPAEVARLQNRLWGLKGKGGTSMTVSWVDHATGVLLIGLDRVDPEFAAELEAAGSGLVKVLGEPHPPPEPAGGSSPPD